MSLIKKTFFLFSFLFFFNSCGNDEIVCNILTGGICAAVELVSKVDDPCILGLSSCNDGDGIAKINEVNSTKNIDPKDLNTTPTVIARNTEVTLNVNEKINVLLLVNDQDLDEVTLTNLVEKPSIALATTHRNPDRVLITALAAGRTYAKVYATDDDNHVGESQFINIRVLGQDANNTATQEYSVVFTKEKITMSTSSFQRIGFTLKGFQADYNVDVTFASSNDTLVDINVSKSATHFDIYSNATSGIVVAHFQFTDSAGVSLTKDLPIEVTNTEILPPIDPSLTAHTVKDSQACIDSGNVWKRLVNSYSIGDRVIDSLNSITFQSLSTETNNIVLYYKNVVSDIQPKPDNGMDIKVDEVPNLDGTRDTSKGFIIQTSKGFFNSGFYYVKIDEQCYRGEFPSNEAVKNDDIYRSVKLVVN